MTDGDLRLLRVTDDALRWLIVADSQACIKVFGAWDPKKVPGNVRNECA